MDNNCKPIGNKKKQLYTDVLTGTTNSSGKFIFNNVTLGDHRIIIYQTDGTTIGASLDIELVKGKSDSVKDNVVTIEKDIVSIVVVLDGQVLTIEQVNSFPQTSDSGALPLLFITGTLVITSLSVKRKVKNR